MEETLGRVAQSLGLALDAEDAGVGGEEGIEGVVGEERLLRRGDGGDEAAQPFLEGSPPGDRRLGREFAKEAYLAGIRVDFDDGEAPPLQFLLEGDGPIDHPLDDGALGGVVGADTQGR